MITIPPRRNLFAAAFLSLWLCGWAWGEITAFRMAFMQKSVGVTLFILVWMTGWTIGGGFALLRLAWIVAGRERIVLGPTLLTLRREVLGIRRSREFNLEHVRRLRVSPQPGAVPDGRGRRVMPSPAGGLLAFDHGSRTERFGAGLDEAEAEYVLALLVDEQRSLALDGDS